MSSDADIEKLVGDFLAKHGVTVVAEGSGGVVRLKKSDASLQKTIDAWRADHSSRLAHSPEIVGRASIPRRKDPVADAWIGTHHAKSGDSAALIAEPYRVTVVPQKLGWRSPIPRRSATGATDESDYDDELESTPVSAAYAKELAACRDIARRDHKTPKQIVRRRHAPKIAEIDAARTTPQTQLRKPHDRI